MMRIKLLLAVFGMLQTLVVFGQTYGLKAGLNLSDVVITNYINPDAESDYRIKPGLHAGVFAAFDVKEEFAVAAEVLYSNKGVKASDNINLHYINLPVLSQYKVSKNFVAEIGPEIGYLFSARSPYGNVSNTWNNKLDIGLDAGVHIRILPETDLVVRYYAGFSSVIDSIDESGTNNVPSGETTKYQNRVLQFSVHYTIARKK